jgi:YVTN family beta-propeller protein
MNISTLDHLLIDSHSISKMGNSSSTAKKVVVRTKAKILEETVAQTTGARLYVANREHPTISVIDPGTCQVIGTIAAGSYAYRLALNPDETRLYVAGYQKLSKCWKIFVIDTNRDKVIAKIGGSQSPGLFLLNPAGTRLYVVDKRENTLSVIDTNCHKVIVKMYVGQRPGALTLNSEGNRLYVTNRKSDTVSVIDIDTNKDTYQMSGPMLAGGYPKALILNPDGTRLYVANKQSDNVWVIDTGTYRAIDIIPVGKSPSRLVLTETCLYVENMGWGDGGSISIIDTRSHQVTSILSHTYPEILALNMTSTRLYVVGYVVGDGDSSSRSWDFFVVDTGTNQVIDTISVDVPRKAMRLPTAFVLDSAEMRFYVLNPVDGGIRVVDIVTHEIIATITVGRYSNPRALVIREGLFA